MHTLCKQVVDRILFLQANEARRGHLLQSMPFSMICHPKSVLNYKPSKKKFALEERRSPRLPPPLEM
jgi:hypothetical protein